MTTVVVTVTPGANVRSMIVIGQSPIGFSDALTSAPFQFPITIPLNIKPGQYSLTADATGAQGQDIKSPAVIIDVEPVAGSINGLQVDPEVLALKFVGAQSPLLVTGSLQSGKTTSLTESKLITYSSSNVGVASVSSVGVVTATGSGSANIVVSILGASFTVPVTVPNSLRGDLNGDGRIDIDDVNILSSSLNTPASGPDDARDLNHDGIINALDARIVTTLCTHARCTAQ